MTKTHLSKLRKAICARNAQWPSHLVPFHPHLWAGQFTAPDPARFAAWRSCSFVVSAARTPSGVCRLSVQRTEVDGTGAWRDGITWDELQRIKGECGFGDFDAIEVYPRDRDVIYEANMRHLWVLAEPLGFAWRNPLGEVGHEG